MNKGRIDILEKSKQMILLASTSNIKRQKSVLCI